MVCTGFVLAVKECTDNRKERFLQWKKGYKMKGPTMRYADLRGGRGN